MIDHKAGLCFAGFASSWLPGWATGISGLWGTPCAHRIRRFFMANTKNTFGAESRLSTKAGDVTIYRLAALAERGVGNVERLPFSMKVVLESALRNLDEFEVSSE